MMIFIWLPYVYSQVNSIILMTEHIFSKDHCNICVQASLYNDAAISKFVDFYFQENIFWGFGCRIQLIAPEKNP